MKRSSKIQVSSSKEASGSKIQSTRLALRLPLLVFGTWILFGVWILVFGVSAAPTAPELTTISISPSDIRLSNRQDHQSLAVQAEYADGVTRDITDKATFTIADKKLAKLAGTTLYPLADGRTELTVTFDGRSHKVPVTIEAAQTERQTSFKLDVIPALTKAGCNAGACHGASRVFASRCSATIPMVITPAS